MAGYRLIARSAWALGSLRDALKACKYNGLGDDSTDAEVTALETAILRKPAFLRHFSETVNQLYNQVLVQATLGKVPQSGVKAAKELAERLIKQYVRANETEDDGW